MKFIKNNILTITIFIVGLLSIAYVNNRQLDNTLLQRALRLEQMHTAALSEVSKSLDKFAGVVAGMHSYLNLSENFPSAQEFQGFVKTQFKDLKLNDSIAVSFIDTNHVFRYSFTLNQMDPANLVNKSVKSLRDPKKIEKLNELMKTDELVSFAPINLVEGYVGIPINFRVHRDGKTLGYVAPLLNFKSIIQEVYDQKFDREVVYHFRWEDEFDFDREAVHDGTKIYNPNSDAEYYKNYNVPSSEFIYDKLDYYGSAINIGIAYKDDKIEPEFFIYVLLIGHLLFTTALFLLNRQRIHSKRLNAELRAVNKTKDKFFSIVGHDLKQPLNSITGLLSLLEVEKIEDQDLRDIVKRLEISTKNTTNLLNNLLRWAASQTGDLNFNPANFSLNELIQEELRNLSQQADNKRITIVEILKPELEIYADRDMLGTVIRNLLSNAIKFSFEGGKIYVMNDIRDENIIISVRDEGMGMKPEELARYNENDPQVSKIGTFGETGTGLGLVLCKDFISKHGGNLYVTSSPQEGTNVEVVVPKKTV